jgi:hypothetical protein
VNRIVLALVKEMVLGMKEKELMLDCLVLWVAVKAMQTVLMWPAVVSSHFSVDSARSQPRFSRSQESNADFPVPLPVIQSLVA